VYLKQWYGGPENERAVLDPHLKSRIKPLGLPTVIVDAPICMECGDDNHSQNSDATGKQREVCPRWGRGIHCAMPYNKFYGFVYGANGTGPYRLSCCSPQPRSIDGKGCRHSAVAVRRRRIIVDIWYRAQPYEALDTGDD
jgi:hypothetical protein